MELMIELLTAEPLQRYGPYRDCPSIFQMVGYSGLHGSISQRRREKIETHMQSCADCHHAIDQLVMYTGEVKKLPPPDKEFEEYLDSLMQGFAP